MPEMLDPVYTGAGNDFPKMIEAVKCQKMAALKEKYEKLMKYMKANDFPKIYVIGFSWGAWFAMKMSAEYDNIKAIVGIHPALQVEKFLGGSEEQLVECVKCPILLEVSSGEGPNVKKGGDLINILTKKFGTGAGVE